MMIKKGKLPTVKKNLCPRCNRKMKQQFIGLLHCKCGMSYHKDMGYFERTGNMIFALEKKKRGEKTKQVPVIRYKDE
ncbi:hypothetical protein [Lachnoanaerobaculum saburreum]|uniref:30S ribosomal protein S6 n=2 Tax=Lachnoanaerobaculum TaxID=1164882 RepID=E6LRQ6_9FIRM|nr:hypothetical protein [Lachnoanaerobaculum saburreum]EFU75457.1 hypothetical protein HMPREF0381_2641 [Lachnoanaerobaculum saburreum DSM 3986]